MRVKENFKKLAEAGVDMGFLDNKDSKDTFLKILEEPLREDDALIKILNNNTQNPKFISLEVILEASFDKAKDIIEHMNLQQRIDMLQVLHEYQSYLYESTGRYGKKGVKKDDQISASVFRAILGKIKHLEILQNWLYGLY